MRTFKLLLAIFSIMCGSSKLLAQESPSDITLGRYKWNVIVRMEEVVIAGTSLSARSFVESRIGQLFDIIELRGDSAIISIVNYPPSSEEAKIYNLRRSGTAASTFYKPHFKVSKDNVQRYASAYSRIKASLNFGLLNFPFKYRMSFKNRGDFAGAFNFGAGLGVNLGKLAYRQGTFAIITGYSISNVVLEKHAVRRNDGDIEEANNYTAFSFSTGLMYEYEKVQVGVSFGADLLNRVNQERFGWRGQGKPWVSVGIGYAIFSRQGKTQATGDKEQPADK